MRDSVVRHLSGTRPKIVLNSRGASPTTQFSERERVPPPQGTFDRFGLACDIGKVWGDLVHFPSSTRMHHERWSTAAAPSVCRVPDRTP